MHVKHPQGTPPDSSADTSAGPSSSGDPQRTTGSTGSADGPGPSSSTGTVHAESSGRGVAPLAVVLGLVALVFGVHLASADFLNFDDPRYFGQGIDRTTEERTEFGRLPEDGIGSELAKAGLAGILDPRETVVDAYLPVAHLSMETDRRLFGGEPLGAHVHSLLLHLAATVLCFCLLAEALGAGLRAALGTALFALHPALAESVLWVSGRKDLLSGLFVFAALLVLVRTASDVEGATTSRPTRRLATVVLGAVGLLELLPWTAFERSMLIAVPVVTALCVFVGRRARRGLAASGVVATLAASGLALLAIYAKGTAVVLGPIAVLVAWSMRRRGRALMPALAVFAVTTLGALHHFLIAASAETVVERSLAESWTQAPGAFLHYLTTSLWPGDLDVLYPERETMQQFRERFVPATVVLVAFIGLVLLALRRGARLTALGLLLFAIALLPFNTVIPATSLAAADRYLYLALPGLALAVVSVRRIPAPALCAPVVVLALTTFLRGRDFVDSGVLWQASLERDPKNLAAAYNLASYRLPRLQLAGRSVDEVREEVDSLLESAWNDECYPQHRFRSLELLARLDATVADYQSAAEHLVEAADEIDSLETAAARPIEFALRLRAVQMARRAADDEIERQQIELAQRLEPNSPVLICTQVARTLREAVEASDGGLPVDDPVFERIETDLERAEAGFTEAESLAGGDEFVAVDRAELHWLRGEIARLQRRWGKAGLEYERAIEIDPRRPEPHLALGAMYLSLPEFAEQAETAIRRALRLGIDDPSLRYQLALALSQQGDIQAARRHFEAYLNREPDDRDAQRSLARILVAEGLRDLDKLDPKELERRALRIQKYDSGLPGALKMRGVASMKLRKFEEAIAFFDRVLEQSPDDPEALRYRAETLRNHGYALQLAGDRPGAIAAFREFVRSAPLDIDTRAVETILENVDEERFRKLSERGANALAAGDPASAEAAFLDCLELRPERVSVRMELGLSRFALGSDRLEAALDDFRAVEAWSRREQLDPTLAVLYQIRTLARLDRAEEALALGDAYLDALPETAQPELVERIRAIVR